MLNCFVKKKKTIRKDGFKEHLGWKKLAYTKADHVQGEGKSSLVDMIEYF